MMYLTGGLLWILIVTCLSEKPDNVLFSSVAEMSKLAKIELTAVSQMEKLRHLIDQRLAKRNHEWSETEELNEVQAEVTQIFDNLPPPSELEGAGNGELEDYTILTSHNTLLCHVRSVPPPGDIQTQRDPVQ